MKNFIYISCKTSKDNLPILNIYKGQLLSQNLQTYEMHSW